MFKTVRLFIAIAALCGSVSSTFAQAPQLINYQGRLNQGGNPADGAFSITFSIYDVATGGTALYAETQNVNVSGGVFNALIGSTTPIPVDLFTNNGDRFLGVKVGSDAEMTPRFRLASVAYALRSTESDGVADGAVVKSVNTLKDDVTLAAGTNVTITPSGNTLTISASGGGNGSGDGHSLDAADGDPIDAVFVDNIGRVGVGTTAPSTALEVAGRVRASGPAASLLVNRRDDNRAAWSIFSPDGSLRFFGEEGTGTVGNAFTIAANGNLGVGANPSLARLHVAGSGLPQLLVQGQGSNDEGGALVITDTNSQHLLDLFSGTENFAAATIRWMTGDDLILGTVTPQPEAFSDKMIVKNSGDVGIGTIDPSAKLDVVGDVEVSGDITVFNDAGTSPAVSIVRNDRSGGVLAAKNSQGNDVAFITNGVTDAGFVAVTNIAGTTNLVTLSTTGAGNNQSGFVSVRNTAGTQTAGINGETGEVFGNSKSFIVPDPQNDRRMIRYTSIEGPEAAIYVRGKAALVGGRATIDFPDHFSALAVPSSITVSLTPRSADSRGLAAVSVSENEMHVAELSNGAGSYEFDYVVYGVRRGFEDYEVYIEKQ
jgi:hypothetical protein